MNARSKAEFINSVVAGETIVCKQCGTANESDSKFCSTCGSKIEAASDSAPAKESAFTPVGNEPAKESAFAPVSGEPAKESAFAPVSSEPAKESAFAPVGSASVKESAFAPIGGVPAKESATPADDKPKPAFAPDASAFPPAKEASEAAPETKAAQETPVHEYVEPKSVFAEGLPEWSIEPPQVVVRRH
ncbi:MAG: zinc ribbon domain-containing protein [Clostridia bacterium]|nr:zinc ribbon domain-containing protein [Clostridia bacterium]